MKPRLDKYLKIGIMVMLFGLLISAGTTSIAEAKPKVKKLKVDADSNLLINKKEKKRLKIKTTPKKASKAVTWSSSKKKVVSVSKKGVIVGRRFGKATITAKAKDGSGKTAKIRVQVGRKITKLQIPTQSMSLEVGQTASVKAKVLPANATRKKLKYQSSNEDAVTVDSTGVVKAKGKGSATITVSSLDGSDKKVACKVQAVILSQSVDVDTLGGERRIAVGKTLTLQAAVNPEEVSNAALQFASTNPEVATVSEWGVVKGINPGTVTIQVTAADGHSTASIDLEVYKVELKGEKLIAHRGFSSQAPENTTAAFRLAVENSFFGVECDVRKTLDDEFVIMHDSDLRRMCGANLTVANMDITQLKKYKITSGSNIEQYPDLTVPTLQEYLEIVATNDTIHPFIELKVAFTEEELADIVEMVDEYGLLDRAYFISIHQSNLLTLKEMDGVRKDQLQYVYGAEDSNKLMAVDNNVIDWCIQHAIDLDARHTLITAAEVSRLHEGGRKVNVWTVNALEKAYEMVTAVGVDMITTEYMLNS